MLSGNRRLLTRTLSDSENIDIYCDLILEHGANVGLYRSKLAGSMSQAKRVKRQANGKESDTKVQVMRVKRQTEGEKSAKILADVYLHVMEEVIQSVREDFVREGVDENVLMKLRQLWESNLRQSRVANRAGTQEGCQPAITRECNPSAQLCDLNVPYGAPDEYQSFINTGEPIAFNCNPPGPNDSTDGAAGCVKLDIQRGEFLSCMPQPDPCITQKQWAVDVNGDDEASEGFQLNGEAGHGQDLVAKDFLNVAMGHRNREELTTGAVFSSNYFLQLEGVKDIPPRLDCSQDNPVCVLGGSGEISFKSFNSKLRRLRKSDADTQVASLLEAFPRDGCIPQYDGVYDDFDNGVLCEDYNEPGDDESHMEDSGEFGVLNMGPAQWGSGVSVMPEERDLDPEEALNKEDQTFVFEAPQAAFKADHQILAKVVNVKRTKNKWKCTLKHGIMNLKNKDYIFLEASGQFEF